MIFVGRHQEFPKKELFLQRIERRTTVRRSFDNISQPTYKRIKEDNSIQLV